MIMMRSARAWGLVVAVCGAFACNPDTSGLGTETAEPAEPSSSGTSTGAATTTSPTGSTSSTTEPVDGTETTAAPGDGTTTTTDGTTASAESTSDTSAPVMMVQRCTMPDLEIPEAPADGVDSMIDIPEDGTIVELRVVVQAVHTWVGDLTFELRKGGDTVVVIDRPGAGRTHCSGNDIDVVLHDDAAATLDEACTNDGDGLPPALIGEVQPEASLGATFVGQSTMGTWQLHVTDNASPDVGRLNTWCLRITYE